MNYDRLSKIIVSPLISEKSSRVADRHHQFAFKVLPDATKPEIKRAVEEFFNVKVKSVTVSNVKGKKKVFKRVLGRRNNWKKAFVTLEEGHDINFVGAES